MSPGTLSVSHPRLEALAAETAAKYETWNLELLADVATRGQTSTTRDYAAMHQVGEWLRGQRIKHERTVAHSSEQNGIAQRHIRTLNNVARCSLAHARLSIHDHKL